MEKDWKIVYENPNEVRVEIVKAVLEESEIPAVIVNQKDTMYQFGNYKVYVNQAHINEATKIIRHDLEFE